MNSAIIVAFVCGAGAAFGFCLIVYLIASRRRPAPDKPPVHESTIYFGEDYYDDIDPILLRRAGAHRYDGMTDGEGGYVPSGLDFGRVPR